MNKILWFRFDLRLHDNEAVKNAIIDGNTLPIFIFDEEYYKLETSSTFHLQFCIDSIEELDSVEEVDTDVGLEVALAVSAESSVELVGFISAGVGISDNPSSSAGLSTEEVVVSSFSSAVVDEVAQPQ